MVAVNYEGPKRKGVYNWTTSFIVCLREYIMIRTAPLNLHNWEHRIRHLALSVCIGDCQSTGGDVGFDADLARDIKKSTDSFWVLSS